MGQNLNKKSSVLKILIIVLSVLLATSLSLLVGVKFVLPAISSWLGDETTVTVPNYITPSVDGDASSGDGTSGNQQLAGVSSTIQPTAPVLEFYQGNAEHNRRFEVRNMVPGDKEVRYYDIRAHHSEDVTLVFRGVVTEQTRNLGDVLDVVVTNAETGAVLCEGTFNEIHEIEFRTVLPANSEKVTDTFYKVEVSMDTSVGNDYQVAHLLADLQWYIDEGSEGLDPPPQTGDSTQIVLWVVIAGSAMLLIFILLFTRRKNEEEEAETDE